MMSIHVHAWDHLLGCSLVPRADVHVTPSSVSLSREALPSGLGQASS